MISERPLFASDTRRDLPNNNSPRKRAFHEDILPKCNRDLVQSSSSAHLPHYAILATSFLSFRKRITFTSRPPLTVWLYGERIATLSEPSYRKLRRTFDPVAEERNRAGSAILSMSMPVDSIRRAMAKQRTVTSG